MIKEGCGDLTFEQESLLMFQNLFVVVLESSQLDDKLMNGMMFSIKNFLIFVFHVEL